MELAIALCSPKTKYSIAAKLARKSKIFSSSIPDKRHSSPATLDAQIPLEERGVAGIILQSPMTSVLRIDGSEHTFSISDMFDNLKKIERIKAPFYLVHGAADEVIPAHHSKVT